MAKPGYEKQTPWVPQCISPSVLPTHFAPYCIDMANISCLIFIYWVASIDTATQRLIPVPTVIAHRSLALTLSTPTTS